MQKQEQRKRSWQSQTGSKEAAKKRTPFLQLGDCEGVYVGESGRSLNERAGEHHHDAGALKEDSHMIKHWQEHDRNQEEVPRFHFKVIGSFQDPLTRQVSEAVRIDLRGGGVLNSKSEYSRCKLPRPDYQ